MDHKTFRQHLCEATGRPAADIDALIDGLAVVLRESCADLDTVAVPTFGSFVAEKHNEEIVNDLSTGKRVLAPPEITLSFHPGSMLQKRLRNE